MSSNDDKKENPPQPDPVQVLLIDDDVALCGALRRALERSGYEVTVTHDGLAGLEAYESGVHHAIISDIEMPGMSGIEVLRAVRRVDLDVPVIFITGAPSVETAIDAVNAGALKYLRKPVELSEVVESLREAADFSRLALVRRQAATLLGREGGRAMDAAGLEAQFDSALGKLWMAYQPIISLSQRRVVAYEALMRSDEPGLQHPGSLLDAAELLGRIDDLTARVCECCAEAAQSLVGGTDLFVNLHPHDLKTEKLFTEDNPLTPFGDRVVLELTERASLADVPDLERRLDMLREWGFRLAVDDLGAGYAGLSCFTRLRPEVVKIDMELIRDIHEQPQKQKIVGSLLDVCDSMGVTAVIEGVEQPGERDTLVTLGADLMQGYLFARPERKFPAIRAGAFLRAATADGIDLGC